MGNSVIYEIYQGDCLVIDRTLVDEDNDNAPFDLSSASVELGLSWPDGGSWSADAADIAATALGKIETEVPASITATLPPGKDVFLQLRVTFAGGCPQTVLAGRVRVKKKSL